MTTKLDAKWRESARAQMTLEGTERVLLDVGDALALLDVAEACATALLNPPQLVAPHAHDDEDPCPWCEEVFRSRALKNAALEALRAVEW